MFDIGKRIRELRKIYKMTSSELANKINISQPQLSRIENNKNLAQIDTIFNICKVLNISLSEFFMTPDDHNYITDDQRKLLNTFKHLSPEQIETFVKLSNWLKR